MKLSEAKKGMRVAYRPHWGAIDPGTISSFNEEIIFVKFDKETARLGLEGATSKACYPEDIEPY